MSMMQTVEQSELPQSSAEAFEIAYAAKMREMAKKNGLTGSKWPKVNKNTNAQSDEITIAIMQAKWENASTSHIARLVAADIRRPVESQTIADRMRGVLADQVYLAGKSNRGNRWMKV